MKNDRLVAAGFAFGATACKAQQKVVGDDPKIRT